VAKYIFTTLFRVDTKKTQKNTNLFIKTIYLKNKTKENIKGFKMLIIKEITHYKNFLNRKLQLPFEALNLCNLVIVKGFDCL